MATNNTPSKFAQFKVVLLGESAVGKSSIVHRFVKNTFDDMRESTIGAAFLTQSIVLPESNTTIKFEIWDTAGQERYKSLAPMYYRKANAALCVYDITSHASFEKAQDWIKELKRQAPEGIVICLVGNKSDLHDERQVTQQEIDDYILQISDNQSKIVYNDCSAKTGEGVLETFNKIARELPVEEAISGTRSRQRNSGVDLGRSNARNEPQTNSCC